MTSDTERQTAADVPSTETSRIPIVCLATEDLLASLLLIATGATLGLVSLRRCSRHHSTGNSRLRVVANDAREG